MTPVPLHCSDSMLYFTSICGWNVCVWSVCALYVGVGVLYKWGPSHTTWRLHRGVHAAKGVWVVYGVKAADMHDPCVVPEMSDRSPPQAYMWQWIPLSPTNQPDLTHMFPIMAGTFQALPSIPQKKRPIMYKAHSDRTKINHTEETYSDFFACVQDVVWWRYGIKGTCWQICAEHLIPMETNLNLIQTVTLEEGKFLKKLYSQQTDNKL